MLLSSNVRYIYQKGERSIETKSNYGRTEDRTGARQGKRDHAEVGEKGITFIDEIEMTAEQAFSSIAPKLGRPSAECEAATAFILDSMKAGKLTATACEGFLKDRGFKKSTIKKAKKNAGVVSVKEGMIWYWTLPTADQEKLDNTHHTDPDIETN